MLTSARFILNLGTRDREQQVERQILKTMDPVGFHSMEMSRDYFIIVIYYSDRFGVRFCLDRSSVNVLNSQTQYLPLQYHTRVVHNYEVVKLESKIRELEYFSPL